MPLRAFPMMLHMHCSVITLRRPYACTVQPSPSSARKPKARMSIRALCMRRRQVGLSEHLPSWSTVPVSMIQVHCFHSPRQTTAHAMQPMASPLPFPNIERLVPAGAAHAIPDSQPTKESPGKHSWNGTLPSQQNDVRKQQRPLTLLKAAAAKRALDRDGAGRKAKPAKQPRSGDARILIAERCCHTRPAFPANDAHQVLPCKPCESSNVSDSAFSCRLLHCICSREKATRKAKHQAGAGLGCTSGPGWRTAP